MSFAPVADAVGQASRRAVDELAHFFQVVFQRKTRRRDIALDRAGADQEVLIVVASLEFDDVESRLAEQPGERAGAEI